MPAQRHFVIRDAVHGDIWLTRDEGRLLDTREMQRLRGVRQLGLAHLVYPGARHSRFEHSIGTLWMAQALVDATRRNADLEPETSHRVTSEECRVLRAAALVHDVTHIPFGHNVEDQCGMLPRHDTEARYLDMLDESGELGRELKRQGLLEAVLGVLGVGDTDLPPFLEQMISDTICSDLMDYLRRDAYFTGLNLHYDARIADHFKIDRDEQRLYVDCEKHGLVREDIVSEILRMLQARYYFSERVYYHHAKIVAGAMVARAVETALRGGWIRNVDLYRETDDGLMIRLRRVLAAAGDAEASSCAGLLERVERRRLYKRAAVFPHALNAHVQDDLLHRFFSPETAGQRRAWERDRQAELRTRCGTDVEVILYCPSRTMQLKEVGTLVSFPDESDLAPLSRFRDRLPRIADLEESYLRLWKVFVLTNAETAEQRRSVQDCVRAALPDAVDAYRIR